MKITAPILVCLPLFPAVSVAVQPAPWTVGERKGRNCLFTPEGKPFMMIGISHAVMALTDGGLRPVAASERARREKKIVSDLRDFGFNTVAVGLSNGGQPDRFAAAITSAGWLGPWFDANAVKDLPIWSFQGAKDKTSQVSLGNSTFERMKELGAKVKFTELAKHGHNVNEAAFAYTGDTETNGGVTKYASDRCDKTADVWDWLFAQKRPAK